MYFYYFATDLKNLIPNFQTRNTPTIPIATGATALIVFVIFVAIVVNALATALGAGDYVDNAINSFINNTSK